MKILILFLSLALSAFSAAPTASFPVGKGFRLTASSDGTPPLTFTWFKDGKQIQQDTSSTISKFTVAASTPADAGTYTVTATNATGTATSTPENSVVIVITAAPPTTPKITAEKLP